MSSITKVYILLLSSFLYHAISCSDMDRSGHGKRVRACVFQPPLPASTWPTCLTYRSHVIATKTRVPRDAFKRRASPSQRPRASQRVGTDPA